MSVTISSVVPTLVRDRKTGSTEHYRTVMAVSATALDREITDADWMARIKAIWDNAPTNAVIDDELDRVRVEMLAYFKSKGEKSVSTQLWNTWIRSTCWGVPGHQREEVEATRQKGRRKGDKNFLCPRHQMEHVKDAAAERKAKPADFLIAKALKPAA